MSIESHYDKTAVITQHDGTLDAWKKPDYSSGNWDQVASQAGCLRPMETREEFMKGKETFFRDAILYTAYNSSVDETMRVTIDNVEYEITGIKNPNSLRHHMEVSLLKII